ncbi:MAG: polysaccharide biosynthesis protein [Candidatus Krumholzibacteriia bacterium]
MTAFAEGQETHPSRPRLLVIGAGNAGQALVRQIRGEGLPAEPVAFLDDDPSLQGTTVCGLPVVGTAEDLPTAVRDTGAQEVLLAIPSAGGQLIRRVVLLARRARVPLRIVPGLRDIIRGDVSFNQVREVQAEHLLGRESVDFQEGPARAVVEGRTVLVTGAGGSIGGELCRRLLPLRPGRLIMLGRGENSLFEMEAELRGEFPSAPLHTVIADVRDRRRLSVVGSRIKPDLILHAAAHKHVPLMEANPEEAVLVNVGGTANLIALAREAGAERFVLISTDKAVAPSSVMGATKKLAEALVRRAAAANGGTRFMTVRFGNVLGSRGSVIPFFKRRIAAGLPLPVTHPDMTRYFMTIKEAALLVIEAMVLGEPGATYILEMGNPVSILELARNLLVLSGFDPDDGDHYPGIEITGLRPGERLHEVLHEEYEDIGTSPNPLIRQALIRGRDVQLKPGTVSGLLELAEAGDIPNLRSRLAGLVGVPALAEGGV